MPRLYRMAGQPSGVANPKALPGMQIRSLFGNPLGLYHPFSVSQWLSVQSACQGWLEVSRFASWRRSARSALPHSPGMFMVRFSWRFFSANCWCQ